jgi:hypothetical protein
LHGFDLKDKYGLNWQFLPEAVNEDDERYLTQRWLNYISLYCTPDVSGSKASRILHAGFLSKRGQRNNALRKRWFVLSSDRMVYFNYLVNIYN